MSHTSPQIHTQHTHVSHQEKQPHHTSNTKLESGTGLDQQQNRRRRVANDPGDLVALSTRTHYNKHMYQILKNGTLVINAQDLQTAIRFVQRLESGLDRATQHSPYTITTAEQRSESIVSPDLVKKLRN